MIDITPTIWNLLLFVTISHSLTSLSPTGPSPPPSALSYGPTIVMDKFGSELWFEPEPPRTEPEVQFKVLQNG
jgi:hypothetical protein